jgi:hypothetical protein
VKLPSLDLLRKAVRPMTQLMIIIMIGPLAVAVGLVEAFVPGAGVRFANGMLTYVKGLPPEFWLFAGGAVGVHTIARSFGKDKEAEAAESMVEAARLRRQSDEEEAR